MPTFSELPLPMKAASVLGGGGAVVGSLGFLPGLRGAKMTLILIGLALVLCALALLLYAFFLMARRKKKAKELEGDISSTTVRSGSSGSAADLGRMEDLRKKFLKGVQDYRKEGYELYAMPWFLIMGEPGSGKTFALKKSNIGFLPGLTDEFSGGAGTYTMDWWFTRDAVLLDTAGRFAMQDATGSGQNSELAELLRLLRKHRRNCPVNGLILVIPAESLLSDPLEDRRTSDGKKIEGIETKAKQLARTIHTVQTELDVRFPVIVWITKSDKVPGFRAFFDGISKERQHQMMGWSNPDDLDTPFRPDQVIQHMDSVMRDLRERRWTLLEQQKAFGDARMIDSVDSLYSFPENFSRIMPALQVYLNLIFVGGLKQPFLRGIYFNSAITEGKEVDKVLAEAMGIPIDEYKAGGAGFQRDKAYFIRDSLAKKLFVEKNLVTRASKAMSSLRRRQWFMVAGVTIGVLAMVTWAWFAHKQLKESIGSQAKEWQYMAERIKDNKLDGVQMVGSGEGRYYYRADRPVGEFNGYTTDATNLLDYYEKLAAYSGEKIPLPVIFKIFASKQSAGIEEREKAWRIAFKTGTLHPVVFATVAKLSAPTEWQANAEEDALIAMLRWEGAVEQGPKFKPSLLTDTNTSQIFFLGSMIKFLTDTNQLPADHERRLDGLLTQCLENDPARGNLASLVKIPDDYVAAENPAGPVGVSLSHFLNYGASNLKGIQAQEAPYVTALTIFNQLKDDEKALLNSLTAPQGDDLSEANLEAATQYFKDVLGHYDKYKSSFAQASQAYAGLETGGAFVGDLLKEKSSAGETLIKQPFSQLLREAQRLRQTMQDVPLYGKVTDFINTSLTTNITALGSQFKQLADQYRPFDEDYFTNDPSAGGLDMEWRFKDYEQGLKLYKARTPNWAGERDKPLKDAQEAAALFAQSLTNRPANLWTKSFLTRPMDEKFKEAMKITADRTLAYQTNFIVRKFTEHCDDYLKQNLAFPYVYTEGGANEALSWDKFLQVQAGLQSLEAKATNLFGDGVMAVEPAVNHLKTFAALGDALTTRATNGETNALSVVIEVPRHPEEAEKYLPNGQSPAHGDSLARVRLDGRNDQVVFVFDPQNKLWPMQVNKTGLLVDAGPNIANPQPADWVSLANISGEWAPLKLLLDKGEHVEGDNYVVPLMLPDKTYFILKIKVEGGRLPRKKDWPRPQ